jgi:hypothetical protein
MMTDLLTNSLTQDCLLLVPFGLGRCANLTEMYPNSSLGRLGGGFLIFTKSNISVHDDHVIMMLLLLISNSTNKIPIPMDYPNQIPHLLMLRHKFKDDLAHDPSIFRPGQTAEERIHDEVIIMQTTHKQPLEFVREYKLLGWMQCNRRRIKFQNSHPV